MSPSHDDLRNRTEQEPGETAVVVGSDDDEISFQVGGYAKNDFFGRTRDEMALYARDVRFRTCLFLRVRHGVDNNMGNSR